MEQKNVLLGIDGGGTSTEFALFTEEGSVLACFKLPGSNASTIGVPRALSIFREGIDRCLSVNGALKGIFMGCAGGKLETVRDGISALYPQIPVQIDSDGVNALLSGEGNAAMICGTGMVFLRHEPEGGYRKFGGWGYNVGDFGSAYNFGKEAFCAAMAYEDGVRSSKLIYTLLKEKLGVNKVRGTMNSQLGVAGVAAFAGIVFQAYEEKDPYAEEILHRELQQLARIACSVCPEGGRILACGGIHRHFGHVTLPILKQYVPENVEFIQPQLPPVYGACREACRRFGISPGHRFFETFAADYKKLQETNR